MQEQKKVSITPIDLYWLRRESGIVLENVEVTPQWEHLKTMMQGPRRADELVTKPSLTHTVWSLFHIPQIRECLI
jgi:hypothetical protein